MRSAATQAGRAATFLLVLLAVLGAVQVARGDLRMGTAQVPAPINPDDPGRSDAPAGWSALQWNLLAEHGVNAPQAWGNLRAAGAPGGRGVTVAVVDTGVAYWRGTTNPDGRPDLRASQLVPGYDFVDDDPRPYDENGHGTHVASTIAEQTDNGYGLAGLAYGAHIMPVRVLDKYGNGDAVTIARGVRFAADHGAEIINLSLSFAAGTSAGQITQLTAAIDYAYTKGSLVVAGAGNLGQDALSLPASSAHVLAVGATTEHGYLANYSNRGDGLDLVAPGGGDDARLDDPRYDPRRGGRPIYQMTLVAPGVNRFAIEGYIGTSMAAPHVSATAALVVASGVIGDDPSPAQIQARLQQTARDLGAPGHDHYYGSGLVDAAKATTP